MILDSCNSTNDELKKMAEAGAEHGKWVSAKRQTHGKGRGGKSWVSEEGNLFLSFLVRDVPAERWSWIPLVAGLSVQRLLGPPLKVKWPNDLYLEGKKVGGILCEGNPRSKFVVVGLGLNCHRAPEDVPQASSLSLDIDPLREEVLEGWLRDFEKLQYGHDFQPEWKRASLFEKNDEIKWNGGSGQYLGLGEAGQLLVESQGKLRELLAEEVNLVRSL